jgi:hypothetical protein
MLQLCGSGVGIAADSDLLRALEWVNCSGKRPLLQVEVLLDSPQPRIHDLFDPAQVLLEAFVHRVEPGVHVRTQFADPDIQVDDSCKTRPKSPR